jgi:shikimate dehydrogenase
MTGRPSRLVLLGHPVRHSLSPTFQNAALRSAGMPITYEALDVPPAELATRVRALVEERAAGNVTIPYKEAFAALCERRTPIAERAGAVNTFWVAGDGAVVGDNTDVGGFDHLATRVLGREPRALRVAVLGAGGASAAVLAAVERWPGCEVTLQNRSAERRDALARRFPVVTRTCSDPAEAAQGCHMAVNATPIGMTDDALPVSIEALEPGAAVVDLVYRRGGTPWVRAARERGLRAEDGLAMLLEQGALAFERWLGIPAPRDVMRAALCEGP